MTRLSELYRMLRRPASWNAGRMGERSSMVASSTILARSLTLTACFALLGACGQAPVGQRIAAPPRTNATLSLNSAIIETTPPGEQTTLVTCQGGPLCRETLVAPGHADAAREADEDCEQRGGMKGSSPCSREGVAASCVLSGEAGPIRVLTYRQVSEKDQAEAVSTMDDLCNAAGGTFELRAP